MSGGRKEGGGERVSERREERGERQGGKREGDVRMGSCEEEGEGEEKRSCEESV